MSKGRKLVGVISDIHIPFEDKRATAIALDYLESLKLDKLVLLGDIVDFMAISRFSRTLWRRAQLQDELDEAVGFLDDVKKRFKKQEILFLKGNHEDRWDRYLIDRAPEFQSVREFDLKSMLKLKDLGIKWVEDKIKMNGMIFYHGDGRCSRNSGYTVSAWMRHFCQSTIIGHIHRQAVVHKRYGVGDIMVGIENGCLCEMDPDYEKSGTSDWQHGGTVLLMDSSSHVNTPYQFQIIGNKLYGSI